MPDYTPQFYIEKLSAIPDERWCCGMYRDGDGRRCVLGHCDEVMYLPTEESRALSKLAGNYLPVADITTVNDNPSFLFPQPTPKARILAALHYIKEKQCPPSP